MRKLFFLFLTLMATASLWAYDFQVGELYYNITSSSEPYTVEVTYLEWNSSNNYAGLTIATIPSTVTYNGTTYSVTRIGYEAFAYCSSLTSVTIPNSVTRIGDYAFEYCSRLTSITIPNSVTSIGDEAFRECSSLPIENNLRYADTYLVEAVDKTLSTYSIKEGTKWIGDYAFIYCSSLTSIAIPNSVTNVGSYAFFYCSSLTTPVYNAHCFAYMPTSFKGAYVIPEGIKQIAGWAFADCSSLTSVTIPNRVTSIGWGAFSGCSSLVSMVVESGNTKYDSRDNCNAIIETATNILIAGCQNTIIPYSVTSIGNFAFEDCYALTSITIPNSVTSIGDYAFRYCRSLTSITIPNSVTSIGLWAFRNCSSLTSVTIGNSVTSIGYAAFFYCSSLTSITIPNSVTSIGNSAFENCSSLTSVTIPNSVTSIGAAAFAYCSSLTSITIPNSVTSIGDRAFYDCSSLTSVTIPNSVTSIGDWALRGCSSLTSVTIPNSVTSIGDRAFYDCSSLDTIYVEASTPPAFGVEVFTNAPISTCYIPCLTTAAYEASDWAQYMGEFVEDCEQCGDSLYWKYTDTQLSIMGYGDMYDYDIKAQPWQQYRNKMQTISLPEGMTSIGAAAFADCKFLNNATIPSSVKEIRYSAFEDCRMLTTLTFAEPSALTSIGNWAFYNCHKLQYITIPEGVTEIGEAAFFDCTYLSELTLPASMEYIADNGFGLCAKLKRINVSATTPPAVEARTFEDVDRTIPVVVPDESVSVYKSAPVWQEFNIVGKSGVPAALDNVDASTCGIQKLLRDGQLLILQDNKVYTIMGQKIQ